MQKVNIQPGQFVWSMQGIADRFDISKAKAYRMVKLLEDEEIVKHKGYSKYSLFTILKRHLYQDRGNADDTTNDTTNETQTIHKQEGVKNEKEGKKKNPSSAIKSFSPPSAEEVAEYCKSRNSPIDAKYFYDLYTAQGRVDTNGKPVLSWKGKVITREKHNKGGSAPIPDKEPTNDKEKGELYVRIGRKKYTELFGIEKSAEANKFKNIYGLDSQEGN